METPIQDLVPTLSEAGSVGEVDDGLPVLSPLADLIFPKHRCTVVHHLTNEAGAAELHLYYGEKEIFFDEPELFAFGETLAKQARFTAGDATTWGSGYEWSRISVLLQQLIGEGVLVHAAQRNPEVVPSPGTIHPSPLPSSICPVPRSWDDCEAITRDLTGRAVELGYLELIVPAFRIAHPALDTDRRQVGEANVFPPGLRLDVPTEWRTCNFPGTRYQSNLPMNVTAMRVMRAHWSQMMAAVARVREGYLRRFPEADGAWTVGHVERLSAVVLAVPTYQLMRRHNRVENGDLHPALSSLFRVTDGVRLTMHQMLLMPVVEAAWSPQQPVTIDEIMDYAERNYSFHSSHGVCAGPRAMVRELIQVLLEGEGDMDYLSVPLDPAVQAAFDDLDAAIDYGLHGLRAYAAVFSLWPVMTRAYEQIDETIAAAPSVHTTGVEALRGRMSEVGTALKRTYLASEKWRVSREDVYADMYQECSRGLGSCAGAPGLGDALAPVWSAADRRTQIALRDILRGGLDYGDEPGEAVILELANRIMDFLLREQAILRAASIVQNEINCLLGREKPKRALTAADINVHNLLQEFDPNRLPYLVDDLQQLLDIHIELDTDMLAITRRRAAG